MRLFTGKTGLTLNQVLPTGRDIAVMPMLGPLAFLARFSPRAYSPASMASSAPIRYSS